MTISIPFSTIAADAAPTLLLLGKATLVLAAAYLLAGSMRRTSAGARHLVWLTALTAVLVLPALSAWQPSRLAILPRAIAAAVTTGAGGSGAPVGDQNVAGIPSSSPASDAAATAVTAAASGTIPSATMNNAPSLTPLQLVLVVWLAFALVFAGWLGHGAVLVRRIVRRARLLDGADWQTPLLEIADRLGLANPPQLLRSDDTRMPFACGLARPTIVLPAESEDWSDDRRRAVLLHELGHLRRRDLIGHTLARLACVVYWFHPLVWTASRRLRLESERACDDLALTCGARASDYAEHLLDIVSRVRHPATPAVSMPMATRKEFEGRMLAILDPELRRKAPGRVQAVSVAGGIAMLAVIVGAASPSPSTETTTPPSGLAADSLRVPNPVPRAETTTTTTRSTRTSATSVTTESTPRTQERETDANLLVVPLAAQAQQQQPQQQPQQQARQSVRDDRSVLLARILTSDTSAYLRRVAAWGLQDYADDEVAGKALVQALSRDTETRVREMAAWSLGSGRSDKLAVDALANAVVRDREVEVRATAAWALGNLGEDSENAVSSLTIGARHESSRVRAVSIWALGNLSMDKGPPVMLNALRDSVAHVRALAAWALFNIRDPDANAPLIAAYERETKAELKSGYLRALTMKGPEVAGLLARLLDSSDQAVRTMAVRVLAGHDSDPWPWPWPMPRPSP